MNDLKPIIETLDGYGVKDIPRLKAMLAESRGKTVRDQIEQRIAVLQRRAPVVGRCIEEKTRDLPVALTEEEALVVARSAMSEIAKVEKLIEGLKEQVKDRKEDLSKQEARRDLAVSKQEELRPVQVQTLIDGQVVRTVRMDTGEELSRRAATDEEMQEPMDFGRDDDDDSGEMKGRRL